MIDKKTGHLFQNFNVKAKRFVGQPMGIHTLSGIPKFIAEFLQLDDAKLYTGHCFRRSSATALADTGVSRMALKRQFCWQSDTVAEGYIGSSKTQKLDVAKALTITSNDGSNRRSEEAETNSKIVKIENCSNIIIHF